MIRALLSIDPIDAGGLLANFLAALDGEQGAVVSFIGLTRSSAGAGQLIEALFLDHHPRLSQASLDEIAAATSSRFAISAIDIVHRAGRVAPSEPIVWVAAAAPHRRAAFDAADFAIDRLKTDAMLWKREDGAGGSTWIEPTAADHAARARWPAGE